MKIYIASTLTNYKKVQELRDALVSLGYEITYDWTLHGSVKGQGEKVLCEVGRLELGGVRTADLLIVLLPGGRGTHTELGVALSDNTPIMLYSDNLDDFNSNADTCSFYWHNNILRLTDTGNGFVDIILQALDSCSFDFYAGQWRTEV